MPENIEHNASIIVVHYHKFLLFKIHGDRYTLIEQSENNRQLTILVDCINLLHDMHVWCMFDVCLRL